MNNNAYLNYGPRFEDFEVGETLRHAPGKTITESDNNLFSLITMNHHPVHIDQAYAEGEQHGKILVVGTLVFSLVVGLTVRDISAGAIANLSYEGIKHDAPVFIGDTLYAETTILEKRASKSKNDRGLVKVETRGLNQKGETVITFKRQILVKKSEG